MPRPPEADLARIQRWCETQVPADMRHRIRIEHQVRGRTVTLLEVRPPAEGDATGWPDMEFARLKYDEGTEAWTLYWFDRNSRAHYYDLIDRHQPLDRLLAEIDADPTGIFKG